MKKYYFKFYLSLFCLLSFSILTSCLEDDGDSGNALTSNTSFEASDAITGEFEATGEFVTQYISEFELHVAGLDIWDSSDPVNPQFLIGIQMYDEEEIELTTGLYTLRDSFLAGGDLGRFGVGLTWWDESRNATIFSEVEQGFIRIRDISETRIRGEFAFDVKSPATGEKIVVREGNFDIRR